MGSQGTSYITRPAAIALAKRKLKKKGWWKTVKKQVKSMDDNKLGNLLDRLIDSALYNFIVIQDLPEVQERLSHYIDSPDWDTHSTGYYIPLKLTDFEEQIF